MRGGAETGDPCDQVSCQVPHPASVDRRKPIGETDAVLMAYVGCVVERPLEVLGGCRHLAAVSGRWTGGKR